MLHVVKFRQGQDGSAALISEVLCTQLLAPGGIQVLDARLVHVSPPFATSYVTKTEIPYTIKAKVFDLVKERADFRDTAERMLLEVGEQKQMFS